MDEQAAVFDVLGDPHTHGGARVTRIDTHAAAVFLAGERVFKIKRAVRFPFLDYSTLEKRKAACEAEIAVNRRLAPQIYLGVVPITREADGGYTIAGKGEPVEWAVEMRRFDEDATLDRLAGRGRIDAALADQLGRAVAAAHADAPPADAKAWIAALGDYIAQNDAAFRERRDLFPPNDVAQLTQASRAALDAQRDLLLARGKQGLVRRGHGDLHLGNIVLIDNGPVLFDAIEFDPVVASGDVLYDLAFLLMDLVERGLDAAANIVFNRYLAETGREEDFDALAALPLFLSLRAAIRAKVTAARLAQDGAKKDDIAKSARGYFDHALRFIAPPAPQLIATGGLSGTGKSVLARALAPLIAPAPGAVLIRSDVLRKTMFGMAETETLPPVAYMPAVTAQIYRTLNEQAARIVRAGHSVVVDAVFADADERDALADAARAAGVRFHGLFLTAELATRIVRVGGRAADASDADTAIVRKQEDYDLGAMRWQIVDAGGTLQETLKKALAAIRSPDEAKQNPG